MRVVMDAGYESDGIDGQVPIVIRVFARWRVRRDGKVVTTIVLEENGRQREVTIVTSAVIPTDARRQLAENILEWGL